MFTLVLNNQHFALRPVCGFSYFKPIGSDSLEKQQHLIHKLTGSNNQCHSSDTTSGGKWPEKNAILTFCINTLLYKVCVHCVCVCYVRQPDCRKTTVKEQTNLSAGLGLQVSVRQCQKRSQQLVSNYLKRCQRACVEFKKDFDIGQKLKTFNLQPNILQPSAKWKCYYDECPSHRDQHFLSTQNKSCFCVLCRFE